MSPRQFGSRLTRDFASGADDYQPSPYRRVRRVRETTASRPRRRSRRRTTTSTGAIRLATSSSRRSTAVPVAYSRVWWDDEADGPLVYKQVCFLDPAFGSRGIGGALLDWNEARLREIATDHDAFREGP